MQVTIEIDAFNRMGQIVLLTELKPFCENCYPVGSSHVLIRDCCDAGEIVAAIKCLLAGKKVEEESCRG